MVHVVMIVNIVSKVGERKDTKRKPHWRIKWVDPRTTATNVVGQMI